MSFGIILYVGINEVGMLWFIPIEWQLDETSNVRETISGLLAFGATCFLANVFSKYANLHEKYHSLKSKTDKEHPHNDKD